MLHKQQYGWNKWNETSRHPTDKCFHLCSVFMRYGLFLKPITESPIQQTAAKEEVKQKTIHIHLTVKNYLTSMTTTCLNYCEMWLCGLSTRYARQFFKYWFEGHQKQLQVWPQGSPGMMPLDNYFGAHMKLLNKIKSQMAAELWVWNFDAAMQIRCDGHVFHRASSSILKRERTGWEMVVGAAHIWTHNQKFRNSSFGLWKASCIAFCHSVT